MPKRRRQSLITSDFAVLRENVTDGGLTFVETDFESTSGGGQPNSRLFLYPTQFHRFAVSAETRKRIRVAGVASGEHGDARSKASAGPS
jgi:hypothetical protein